MSEDIYKTHNAMFPDPKDVWHLEASLTPEEVAIVNDGGKIVREVLGPVSDLASTLRINGAREATKGKHDFCAKVFGGTEEVIVKHFRRVEVAMKLAERTMTHMARSLEAGKPEPVGKPAGPEPVVAPPVEPVGPIVEPPSENETADSPPEPERGTKKNDGRPSRPRGRTLSS